MQITLKTVLVFAGLICSVVGIIMNNWKIATVGNSLALFGFLII